MHDGIISKEHEILNPFPIPNEAIVSANLRFEDGDVVPGRVG